MEQMTEEKQVYEIIRIGKDDSFFDSNHIRGTLVVIEEGNERIGPWYKGWLKTVGSNHRYYFLKVLLKKHTPNSDS